MNYDYIIVCYAMQNVIAMLYYIVLAAGIDYRFSGEICISLSPTCFSLYILLL